MLNGFLIWTGWTWDIWLFYAVAVVVLVWVVVLLDYLRRL